MFSFLHVDGVRLSASQRAVRIHSMHSVASLGHDVVLAFILSVLACP